MLRARATYTDARVIPIDTDTAGQQAASAPISAVEFVAACNAFGFSPWAVTRRQQLADQITQAVAAGQLREGTKLPAVHEVATVIGVSVKTVRGALALSCEHGCVVRLPRRGYVVAPFVLYRHFFANDR